MYKCVCKYYITAANGSQESHLPNTVVPTNLCELDHSRCFTTSESKLGIIFIFGDNLHWHM